MADAARAICAAAPNVAFIVDAGNIFFLIWSSVKTKRSAFNVLDFLRISKIKKKDNRRSNAIG